MAQPEVTRGELLWLTVLVEGGLAVLAGAAGWALDVLPWQTLSWDVADFMLGIIASLPMLALFFVCLRWPIGPLRKMESFADDVLQPTFRRCSLIDLAMISLFAGVGEELFFRGLLQPYLAQKSDDLLALVLTSIVFGLFHPISIVYVVLAGLFGVYLGWLMLATGNILAAIVAHAAYDFAALVWLVRYRRRPEMDEAPATQAPADA